MSLKCVKADSPSAKLWLEKSGRAQLRNFHYCKYGEVGFIKPSYFSKMVDHISNFRVRPDDIWVISFPKSGITWTLEMVWLIANQMDLKAAKEKLRSRVPFFEKSTTTHDQNDNESYTKKYLDTMKSPRVFKSHLHFEILPKEIQTVKPKIIYVARNVNDVVVSFFDHYRLLRDYEGTINDFVEAFISNNVNNAPYWEHLKVYWEKRNYPNVLFLTYEEMKMDLRSVIWKVAQFIGKNLTEDDVELLNRHLSFEEMKNNVAVNKVEKYENVAENKMGQNSIRKGKIGSGEEELPYECLMKLKKWISENKIPSLHEEYY